MDRELSSVLTRREQWVGLRSGEDGDGAVAKTGGVRDVEGACCDVENTQQVDERALFASDEITTPDLCQG